MAAKHAQPDIPDFAHDAVLSLPPLPEAAQRILQLARDPDVDFRQIVDVVSVDQTLTARVLRVANSAMYGTTRDIDTIRQATVFLGRETIIQLALGVSVLNLKVSYDEIENFSASAFWQHSIAVAIAARYLAQEINVNPEEAFIAGLMHDIGKLVLIEHFGERYAKIFGFAQQGGRPLHQIEYNLIGVDHAVVGQALCQHWKLPPLLAQAVTGHHTPHAEAVGLLPAVVQSANAFAKTIGLGVGGNRYVMCTGRPLSIARNRDLVIRLPKEVREMEAAFRSAPSAEVDGLDDGMLPPERLTTYVNVQDKSVDDALTVALWSMGYEPVSVDWDEGALDERQLDDDAAGVITDRPEQLEIGGLARMDVPVLNYRRWASQHGQAIEEEIDMYGLRTWLKEGLYLPAHS